MYILTMFCDSGECSWLREMRGIQNSGIGVCLYNGKQLSCFPERRTSQNATSAEFLEDQIPPCVLVYGWVSCVKC